MFIMFASKGFVLFVGSVGSINFLIDTICLVQNETEILDSLDMPRGPGGGFGVSSPRVDKVGLKLASSWLHVFKLAALHVSQTIKQMTNQLISTSPSMLLIWWGVNNFKQSWPQVGFKLVLLSSSLTH